VYITVVYITVLYSCTQLGETRELWPAPGLGDALLKKESLQMPTNGLCKPHRTYQSACKNQTLVFQTVLLKPPLLKDVFFFFKRTLLKIIYFCKYIFQSGPLRNPKGKNLTLAFVPSTTFCVSLGFLSLSLYDQKVSHERLNSMQHGCSIEAVRSSATTASTRRSRPTPPWRLLCHALLLPPVLVVGPLPAGSMARWQ
jgi:hypothetical protein